MISGEPKEAGGRQVGDRQQQSLRDHLRRRPDDGAAWLALARALLQAPQASANALQHAELQHALEQAIRSTPESLDAWLLAASVHQRQRGPAAALQWLQFSARQNPQLRAPRVAMSALQADGHRLAGRWTEALAAYRAVEQFSATDPWLLNNIGTCLASQERYEEARSCFEKSLRQHPDFPEARLNLGFLHACQGRDAAALAAIDEVLDYVGIDAATRRGAESMRRILGENARLLPHLASATASGDIEALQRAIADRPRELDQPHDPTLKILRGMAEEAAGLDLDPGDFGYPAGDFDWPLVEAFTQCKLPGGGPALAGVQTHLTGPTSSTGADPDLAPDLAALRHMRRVVRDRARHDPAELSAPGGEAWLKYWHGRLLGIEPDKRPGQYKIARNTDGLPTTPSDHVGGTFRVFLAEILPLPGCPLARGLLAYVACNLIHGFADGNGRLSRFLLAWHTSAKGLPPPLIPLETRTVAARAVNEARQGAGLQPLLGMLREAGAGTARLLDHLQR